MRLHILPITWCFACCLYFQGVVGQQDQKDRQPPPGGYYTTRYDHIDIEHILNQKRLVHYYSECLLDRGPCTPQGIEFKRILPEALRTNCLRCSEKQRFVTLKSIKRLKKEYPSVWAELAAIWDPTGEYLQQLEDSLKGKPFKLPEVSREDVNDVSAPRPSNNVPIFTRFDDEHIAEPVNNVPNVRHTEVSPSTKPQIQTVQKVTANTVSNKPVSFTSTTTTTTTVTSTTAKRSPPVAISSTGPPTIQKSSTNVNTIRTTTKRLFMTGIQDKIQPTTSRISYNYDFSATVRPIQIPGNGINMVIKGVNTLIQPITDIAGRVITAGTDIAGIVLNALGVRRTY